MTGKDADLDRSDETTETSEASQVLDCLSAGVPLTLLWDLASAHGPDSDAIFSDEPPDSLDWIPSQRPEMPAHAVNFRP
jgi:hypothetical protein